MPKYCLCHSGKSYSECCQPFHQGNVPSTALELMRSRYCAYAKSLADYITTTTHPDHPSYKKDTDKWKKEILTFCQNTEFRNLEIVEFLDGKEEAFVTFTAYLDQHHLDTTFTEKSRFLKVDDRWLYRDSLFLH